MKTLVLRFSGLLGLTMSTAICLMPAFAQAPTPYAKINAAAAANPIEVRSLRVISVLERSSGNVGVLAGPDGLLMVDGGIAVSEQKLDAVLQRLKPGPVSYLINTHWHWDHTDGNGWVHKLIA
jgi:glyoxylase-like metal-dependent hydrolase (beta-lactamase superfamily II)